MDGTWHGFADFLKRVGRNPIQYECIDTKLGRTPAPRHLIQLAVYSDLLGELQQEAPHAMSFTWRSVPAKSALPAKASSSTNAGGA